MINIREGTFETNSSSTHSMIIVEDSQLEKWKKGELWYIEKNEKFVNEYAKDKILEEVYGKILMERAKYDDELDEIIEAIKEKRLKEFVKEMIDEEAWYVDRDELPQSFDDFFGYWDARELEVDETTYTTPKGEKLHIYCQYGYDG